MTLEAERAARRGRARQHRPRRPRASRSRSASAAALDDAARRSKAPFDLVFIDADKGTNPDYLGWALRLSRPGSVIVCDNVVRDGRITDATASEPDVTGTRRFFEPIAAEPRLTATAIQTVGAKGWDGFAIAVVAAA